MGYSKRQHVRRQHMVKQRMIYAPLMFCIRIQGLIHYFLRRLRFVLTNMYVATIKIYCNPQAEAAAIATSTSATLQLTDKRSLYYCPTFFHPLVNRTMFPAFHRPLYPPINRLVGPVRYFTGSVLKTSSNSAFNTP